METMVFVVTWVEDNCTKVFADRDIAIAYIRDYCIDFGIDIPILPRGCHQHYIDVPVEAISLEDLCSYSDEELNDLFDDMFTIVEVPLIQ